MPILWRFLLVWQKTVKKIKCKTLDIMISAKNKQSKKKNIYIYIYIYIYIWNELSTGDSRLYSPILGRLSLERSVWGQPRHTVEMDKSPSQPIAGHCSVHLSSQNTQETKIGRIAVLGQTGQKSLWDPISMGEELGLVACTCHPSYGRKSKIKVVRPAWA
jgi:hypothetical protein